MAVAPPRVPAPSVAISDRQTGLLDTNWYDYLASLRLAAQGGDGSTVLRDFANDAAAAAGGVVVNGLYRTGSIVKIRVT